MLDAALSNRYRYPKAAYSTVKMPSRTQADAGAADRPVVANAIRTALPGIVLFHDRVALEPAKDWQTLFDRHGLCFVTVVERHGKSNGNVAHGLLKDFGLKRGAVASSRRPRQPQHHHRRHQRSRHAGRARRDREDARRRLRGRTTAR